MTTAQFVLDPSNWSLAVIIACAIVAAIAFRSRVSMGYFVAALAIVVLAIGSPLDVLAAGYSFSAHMMQHMLLLLIAPALVLLSMPARRLRVHPVLGWIAGVSAMWIWHARTLCELAATTESARMLQIVSLLVVGAMFWSPIVGRRLSP